MTQAALAQNWFATLALLAWPFIALWLYRTRPVSQATLWTILGGYLLLPVGASVKLAEGIPQLDKISVPALAALVGCFFFARRPLRFCNGFGLAEVLLLTYLISPFVTSELNNDPVLSGAVVIAWRGRLRRPIRGRWPIAIPAPIFFGAAIAQEFRRHRGNTANSDRSWACFTHCPCFLKSA